MAKKMNLLLTLTLAVVCLAALLGAVLLPTATPAQAADYEYVKTTFPTASDTPILMLGKYNNVYYAVTANGTSLKVTKVDVEGDKVTSAVTDDMLWIVGKSGYYFTYKSVSKGTYLNLADWSVSLSSTVGTFYNGNPLQTTAGQEKYLSITSAAVTYNSSAGTTIEAFAQTAKQASTTEKTITFAKGNDAATGTMADVTWDTATGDYTLPECGFAYPLYKFVGWKIGDTEDIKAAGAPLTVSDNLTLTAVWEYNAWEITFKMDGKDVVKQAEKDAQYTMPNFTGVFSSSDLPEGQLFVKWQDAEGNDYFNGTKYSFDKNMELTPVFGNAVTISFDFNGGHAHTGNPSYFPETKTYEYAAGSEQKITTSYNPQRDNYTLTGWKCGDLVVKSGETFTVADEDMCFVAQWKYDGVLLTFNDGTNSTNVELASGTTSYTIAVNDPTAPQGKKFLGWQIEGDESGTLYNKNDNAHKTITIEGDALTLNAVYRDLKTYTVTLHNGATTKEVQFVEGTQNIVFNLDVFTSNQMGEIDADHTFDGWYKDEAFTDKMSVSNLTADDSFENLHLYAKVSAYFHVLFDWGFKANASDKTNIVTDRRAVVGSQGVVALHPESGSDYHERVKYTLLGWATEQGGAVVYAADGRTNVTEPCTLYAVWDYDFYVVTIKLAGASEPVGTAEVAKNRKGNTTFKINELKDADDHLVTSWPALNSEHKDAAWTLVKEEDRRDYAVTESITLNSDVILEVRLTDHIYTLTVSWVGGTLATIKQAYNTDVTAPETDKAGYRFVAFYLNNEQGGEFTFGKMPGQDVTVWAKYEILDSTLKFATGNGATVITDVVAKTGSQVSKPADPERTGYEFVKWQIAGSDVQWLVKDGTSANPEYYINMPGGTTTMTAVWDMTEEGKAALKEQKIDELEAYAAELGVQLPDNATTGISNASTEEAILAAFDAAKAAADELKTALDAAKAAAKAEVNAAATAAGVDAPSLAAIDSATSVEAVNTAKTAALAKVAEAKASKDKVDAAKAAVAALQGKSGAELYGLIKAADTALNALSADEKAQVNLEAYNQAKTAYSAFVAGVNADLEVAEKAGASMVAVSFASVAALAMLAFVLKRRMF